MTSPLHPWSRRQALTGMAVTLAAPTVLAQNERNAPIRLIVAFAPGSGNDQIARELAPYMSETLAQTIVVENRPGAGGMLGTEAVARAAPDGLTIGLGTSSQMVMNVGLYQKLPFDIDQDLRMIGLISRTSMLLAGKANGPHTLQALIAHAKANPGQVTYGSAGVGSISHIVGAAFERAAGIELTHVPYKGNGPAMTDLTGGHVDLVFDGLSSSVSLAEQGRIRLLAISGEARNASAPDLPTFGEQGMPNYDAYSWNCLFAPSGTPKDRIAKLNDALNQALEQPSIQERFARFASSKLGPTTPDMAEAYGKKERERWVPFVRSLQLQMS